MRLKPLRDKILIEPIASEETTTGIIIPKTVAEDKPETGKVLKVGPGRLLDNGSLVLPVVKKGDTVLFVKHGPDEINIDGKDYLIADDDDILAIIENVKNNK